MFYKYKKNKNLKREPQKQRIGFINAFNTSTYQKAF